MKIEQSNVTLKAEHQFSSESEIQVDTSKSFRAVFDTIAKTEESKESRAQDLEKRVLMLLDQLIKRIMEIISKHADSSGGLPGLESSKPLNIDDATQSGIPEQLPQRTTEMAWKSELTETLREHESTDFSSSGKVLTADGKTLDFKFDLAMCRDYACERKVINSGTVTLRDPLVINFDGRATELSGKNFEFDLDADGKSENIPGFASGTGYLAFDSNADGHINNGNELFGTRSGNGFADLAALDGDGNFWLDDNDSAFANLRIWQRGVDGQDSLSTLHDKGVGALYLGSAETPFSLKNADNQLQAQIRSSGIYLREDGGTGALQQVDLAV